ncbi:MAG: heparan-alpha-glucosaminide N-acetyltransferase domain-containing protein, partial [Bacteroidota bacterium]
MRGVAVVVMVMGHSIDSVLSLDVRATEAFRLYDAVRGFTAPIFLFVAGFAFTIVTQRRWLEYKSFSPALRSRLLKILLLLLVGYALHLPFFSLNKLLHETKPEEYAQLFQVDVLHCVAVSILMLQAMVFLARSPKAFGLSVTAATGLIVLATPYIWSVDFGPLVSSVLAPYLNQARLSIFPVFAYSAFMLAGAAIAHYFLV